MGCTEGRTGGRGTLPAVPPLLKLQLATWGVLKCHDQSAEPLLSLLETKSCQGNRNVVEKTQITARGFMKFGHKLTAI